jgi:hypothetical protein
LNGDLSSVHFDRTKRQDQLQYHGFDVFDDPAAYYSKIEQMIIFGAPQIAR